MPFHPAPQQEMPRAAGYLRSASLATAAPAVRLGLHPARLPPLRRVGHGAGGGSRARAGEGQDFWETPARRPRKTGSLRSPGIEPTLRPGRANLPRRKRVPDARRSVAAPVRRTVHRTRCPCHVVESRDPPQSGDVRGGQCQEFVVAVQEVADAPGADRDAAADQLGVDLREAAMLRPWRS